MSYLIPAVSIKVTGIPKSRVSVIISRVVPGISVTGQAVTPADLNENIPLPDLNNMTFPVYLDLERDFPFWESKTEAGFVPLAQVEIKNGQVFVNGRLVSENGVMSLKKECESERKK